MSLFDSASLVVTPSGYKEDKLYSIKPTDGSGDLVVTRATTATRVNSDGLIEQVPYNLLQRSEQFDNATWSKVSCSITANATTAPNGTTTADLLTSDNIGSFGRIQQTLSASGIITLSLFVKQNTANLVSLYLTGTGIGAELGANLIYDFNFTTNTLVKNASSSSTATSTQVENFDNNWKRISVTVSSTTITDVRVYSNWSTINNFSTFIWGAQLVTGTSAKEYFPTTDRLDIPRLDYTNSSCPSILVEPQRTNLLLRSEEFDNASWTKTDSTITANSTTAPNGTLTADSLIENTSTNVHRAFQTLAVTGTHTYSFYVKANGRQWIAIGAGNTSSFGALAYFDIQNGVLGTVSVGSANIQNAGNGWFRCSVTGIGNGGGTSFNIWLANANNSISYLGNGTSGVYLWGAQLEAGSNATSYIPTIASSVTRNADVISKSGIGSLFGTNKGTVFCDFVAANIQGTSQYIFDTSDGSNATTNRFAFYKIAAGSYELFTNTATSVSINSNTRNKVAITWNGSSVKVYANGVLKNSITYANANPTKINLGTRYNNIEVGDVNYNSYCIFPTDLTDAQLIELTTI